MGELIQIGQHHGDVHGVATVVNKKGLSFFFNEPSAEAGSFPVEGAPVGFPLGAFLQIGGLVLGLGRQIDQGTDGTMGARQHHASSQQNRCPDFPSFPSHQGHVWLPG